MVPVALEFNVYTALLLEWRYRRRPTGASTVGENR